MTRFQPPRGMRDLGPTEYADLAEVSRILESTAAAWGFRTVQTPVLEQAELFEVKSGVDIRQQLYLLTDKGGRELALRPDITPALTRYFGAACQSETKPVRLVARDRVWRYEAPQAGRFREINQFNVEQFGGRGVLCDAEIMSLFVTCLERLNLEFEVQLGDRRLLTEALRMFGVADDLQADVVRVLDKADKIEREELETALVETLSAQTLDDPLDTEASAKVANQLGEFAYLLGPTDDVLRSLEIILPGSALIQEWKELCGHLVALGVAHRCRLRPGLARGFDYYNGVLMEAVVPNTLGIGAVGGGGRYDDLTKVYGYPPTPSAGFSFGLDRIVMVRLQQSPSDGARHPIATVVGFEKPEFARNAAVAAKTLRATCNATELVYEPRSLRKIEEHAKRRRARWCLVVGDQSGSASLVDLADGRRTHGAVAELMELMHELHP